MPQMTRAASMGASHQNFDLDKDRNSSYKVLTPDLKFWKISLIVLVIEFIGPTPKV